MAFLTLPPEPGSSPVVKEFCVLWKRLALTTEQVNPFC